MSVATMNAEVQPLRIDGIYISASEGARVTDCTDKSFVRHALIHKLRVKQSPGGRVLFSLPDVLWLRDYLARRREVEQASLASRD
jgi:hypothetical protein